MPPVKIKIFFNKRNCIEYLKITPKYRLNLEMWRRKTIFDFSMYLQTCILNILYFKACVARTPCARLQLILWREKLTCDCTTGTSQLNLRNHGNNIKDRMKFYG